MVLLAVRRTRACAEEPTRFTHRPVPAVDAAAALVRLCEAASAAGWGHEPRTGFHVCPACLEAYKDDWPAQLAD
jgi:hypothetical protein